MCVGKALTGGYLSLAATLCAPEVAAGISRGEVPVFAHGPTFMGNPLAAAVASASIGLLLDQDWRDESPGSRRACGTASHRPAGCPACADVRVLGAIGVVELDHEVDIAVATAAAVAGGRLDPPVPRPRLHDAALRHRR